MALGPLCRHASVTMRSLRARCSLRPARGSAIEFPAMVCSSTRPWVPKQPLAAPGSGRPLGPHCLRGGRESGSGEPRAHGEGGRHWVRPLGSSIGVVQLESVSTPRRIRSVFGVARVARRRDHGVVVKAWKTAEPCGHCTGRGCALVDEAVISLPDQRSKDRVRPRPEAGVAKTDCLTFCAAGARPPCSPE